MGLIECCHSIQYVSMTFIDIHFDEKAHAVRTIASIHAVDLKIHIHPES